MGSTSAPQSVSLTNAGTAALSISSFALGGANSADFSQTSNCGSSLAAGANCAINVQFTPAAVGSRSASLTVTDNASGSPQMVSLTGTGAQAAAVTLSPSGLDFGQQNTSVTTAPQTVTLSNSGASPLGIANIAIGGGNSRDFAQANNCGSSLAAGANCAINVTFTPITTGSRNASLIVSNDASGSPLTVSLAGMGVQLAIVSLSPSSLTFAPENIYLTTAPQTVTLSNTGSGLLIISNIAFANGDWSDFIQSSNCGSSVPSGSNCQISVKYSPHIVGAVFTDLAITDNAGGSPQTAIVNATGAPSITPPGNYWVNVNGASSGGALHGVQVTATVQ
jgi:hypothetical protein